MRSVTAALESAHRQHWGPLMALLVGRFRRLELAEDALADAFLQASRRWPADGVPDSPAAWLHTAARRRAVDVLRAEAVRARRAPELVVEQADREARAERTTAERLAEVEEEVLVRDDVLRLVFLCCHPALSLEARAALTLRLVVGLPTTEIARLFLVSEPTMAARLTRARKKLVGAGVALRMPSGERLDARVEDVLRVVYLTFTAGYAPGADASSPLASAAAGGAARGSGRARGRTAGVTDGAADGLGPADEAVRLGRLLDALLPGRADVRSLLALMLLQHSRRDARVSATGELVLLPDQDRGRWHHDEIDEGLRLLATLPAPTSGTALELHLQALVAAVHAGAPSAADTDWALVAGLYARLEGLTGSVVVRLNRAVAVAEVDGPAAGLALLSGLDAELPRSHRLPAVRAELLLRSDRPDDAAADFERALELCPNEIERAHLRHRLDALRPEPVGERERPNRHTSSPSDPATAP